MSDEFTFKLDYPLTQEQIDVITDAELEHTSKIWFTTRSGKEVEFVKAPQWIPCESITEPIDREVLCCDKYGNELIGWLDYNDSYECWVCESDECVMYDTIAYMEKPKPYERETE